MAQEHSPHSSPFNWISNELVASIFARVQSVSAKIRLGRVCTRFHQCLLLGQSWRFNTELNVSPTSVQSLLPFIKHFPRFTSVKIDLPEPQKKMLDALVSALQSQSHKLSLIVVLDVPMSMGGESEALEWFLLDVANLTHPLLMVLHLCFAHSDQVAIKLIQHSHRLRSVSLNMDAYQDYRTVLRAMHNKPLVSLALSNALPRPPFIVHACCLAAVINAVTHHSLRVLALFNCEINDDFVHHLTRRAARAIRHLVFTGLRGNIRHTIGELFCQASDLLPRLTTMIFTQVHPTTTIDKMWYSSAISGFLIFEDPVPVIPRLEFRIQRARGSWISEWMSPSALDWWREINGDLGLIAPPDKYHWHTTTNEENATALVYYDKD